MLLNYYYYNLCLCVFADIDNIVLNGVDYSGYGLSNVQGNNMYPGLELSECQQLCQKTSQCFYFNYNTELAKTRCFLKYGMGSKGEKTKAYFGHKESGRKYFSLYTQTNFNFLNSYV